jgi:tetratricopeptide (TPR) repeat protein
MNASTTKILRSRRPVLAICGAMLAIGQVAVADDEGRIQTLIHDKALYGAEDIENGQYEAGIEKLSKRADGGRQAHSTRVPALIDLCAAYTMTQQHEKAQEACDRAVESGWYSGHAYNNRGAYNISIGNYEAAIEDFELALEGRGADRVARSNLEHARTQLVAMQQRIDEVQVVATSDAPEASE